MPLGRKNAMKDKKKRNGLISIILFAAALAMCIYGALDGEAKEVLIKATKICLECIGLG